MIVFDPLEAPHVADTPNARSIVVSIVTVRRPCVIGNGTGLPAVNAVSDAPSQHLPEPTIEPVGPMEMIVPDHSSSHGHAVGVVPVVNTDVSARLVVMARAAVPIQKPRVSDAPVKLEYSPWAFSHS